MSSRRADPGAPQAGRRVYFAEMSPVRLAVYETLADGEWHHRDDVVLNSAKAVPVGRAVRVGSRATGPVDLIVARARGARAEVLKTLSTVVRWEDVERDGDGYRLVATTRRNFLAWRRTAGTDHGRFAVS